MVGTLLSGIQQAINKVRKKHQPAKGYILSRIEYEQILRTIEQFEFILKEEFYKKDTNTGKIIAKQRETIEKITAILDNSHLTTPMIAKVIQNVQRRMSFIERSVKNSVAETQLMIKRNQNPGNKNRTYHPQRIFDESIETLNEFDAEIASLAGVDSRVIVRNKKRNNQFR